MSRVPSVHLNQCVQWMDYLTQEKLDSSNLFILICIANAINIMLHWETTKSSQYINKRFVLKFDSIYMNIYIYIYKFTLVTDIPDERKS